MHAVAASAKVCRQTRSLTSSRLCASRRLTNCWKAVRSSALNATYGRSASAAPPVPSCVPQHQAPTCTGFARVGPQSKWCK